MTILPIEVGSCPVPSNLDQKIRPLVLQPKGCLDQETSSCFQAVLEQTLRHDATTVIVDLIAVTMITSDGIEALKIGLKLAFSLGKDLVVWSADAATHAALDVERDRQQTQRLSDRTEIIHPSFQQFLGRQAHQSEPNFSAPKATLPLFTPSALKPRFAPPTLVVSSYTSDSWRTSPSVSQIA